VRASQSPHDPGMELHRFSRDNIAISHVHALSQMRCIFLSRAALRIMESFDQRTRTPILDRNIGIRGRDAATLRTPPGSPKVSDGRIYSAARQSCPSGQFLALLINHSQAQPFVVHTTIDSSQPSALQL
jgi:hypothetical protein